MSIALIDETLIEAVRGQKILYEKSHPKYHDNGAKSKASQPQIRCARCCDGYVEIDKIGLQKSH